MNCPIDNTNLQMTSRDGVEIDYCPNCRGVWLDRGELDKIIDRSGSSSADQYNQPQRQEFRDDRRHDDYKKDDHRDRKHKKESFLGDLFDF